MKLTFTLIVVCLSLGLMAQKGTLDKSFGENGMVTTSFGYGTAPQINKAVLQSDDKIIEVGNYNSDIIDEPQGFLVVRYKDDGTLDSEYGNSGKTVIKFSFEDQSFIKDAAIQNDNKILLAGLGWSNFMHPVYSGIIARLNANGLLDSSFGVDGAIQISSKGQGGYGAIALVSDNKFIAVGGAGDSSFIVRYLEDGTLDRTFGQNGYAFISKYFSVFTCKIQTDGKIVIGGYDGHIGFPKFCIQRFLSNGETDSSFGNDGTVLMAYSGDESQIHDLAFQSNGKIVVTGETTTYSSAETNFATARYNTDGSLDSSFGINGKFTTVFSNATSVANSLIILKDDKIIIGGNQAAQHSNFAITRLTVNGLPDSIFGEAGNVVTDFGYPSYLQSVLLQTNDKIVAAGAGGQQPPFYCSLARYNEDLSKKQIIVQKVKHYIQTRNAQATTLNIISIYPNPAQNSLHVEGLSSSQKIKLTVVDFRGNVIVSRELSVVSGVYDLNIASLHAGNYLLKIETNGEVVTKQFVKE